MEKDTFISPPPSTTPQTSSTSATPTAPWPPTPWPGTSGSRVMTSCSSPAPTSTARRSRTRPRGGRRHPPGVRGPHRHGEGPPGVLDLWKLMNISNDRFIRTTDDYHVAAIQKIFKRMYDKGTSTRAPTRASTASPASPSGRRASWWTAAAPTAAGLCRTPRRRPTSSACEQVRRPVRDLLETPTSSSPAPGSTRW